LNKDNIDYIVMTMNHIIDNNAEIVNNIREIYSIAPANKLRELIENILYLQMMKKKRMPKFQPLLNWLMKC